MLVARADAISEAVTDLRMNKYSELIPGQYKRIIHPSALRGVYNYFCNANTKYVVVDHTPAPCASPRSCLFTQQISGEKNKRIQNQQKLLPGDSETTAMAAFAQLSATPPGQKP